MLESDINQQQFRTSAVRVFRFAGDKRLAIILNGAAGMAQTQLYRFEDQERVVGATTLLYSQARDLMIEAASFLGRPLEYCFSTTNPKMKAWALDPKKGQGIFDWDIRVGKKRLFCTKLIKPATKLSL